VRIIALRKNNKGLKKIINFNRKGHCMKQKKPTMEEVIKTIDKVIRSVLCKKHNCILISKEYEPNITKIEINIPKRHKN
jgi:hypothetical protein